MAWKIQEIKNILVFLSEFQGMNGKQPVCRESIEHLEAFQPGIARSIRMREAHLYEDIYSKIPRPEVHDHASGAELRS